jgi:hypothetical protein
MPHRCEKVRELCNGSLLKCVMFLQVLLKCICSTLNTTLAFWSYSKGQYKKEASVGIDWTAVRLLSNIKAKESYRELN